MTIWLILALIGAVTGLGAAVFALTSGGIIRMMRDLAAYKATGLSPEDIKFVQSEIQRIYDEYSRRS